MKVTGHRDEDRQLQIEGWSQRVPLETEGYAGASDCEKMTENNATNTGNQKGKLMEMILSRGSLNAAYKKGESQQGRWGSG